MPLVATTGGALPEVAGTHGETCFLVPPADSEAMAQMLRRALDDDAWRARVGAAGRQRVIDNWSWQHTARATVEQYRRVLADTRADVLTVDYDRLGLQAGERLLDIGCGFGRHTYEGVRRGTSVVSCDLV